MDDPMVKFVIIGDGEKKDKLASIIRKNNLKNCLLLPYQQPEVLPYSLASADIAIVTLGKNASRLSVPSKTYNMMSVGAPLLCIADQKSELYNLVRKYEIGECFLENQIEEMKSFVEKLLSNKHILRQYGTNSLKASKNFGSHNINQFLDSQY